MVKYEIIEEAKIALKEFLESEEAQRLAEIRAAWDEQEESELYDERKKENIGMEKRNRRTVKRKIK